MAACMVILGFGEETKHTSMPEAIATVGTVDAALVGEPTNLELAVAQRGLMMVDLIARGDQRHAGYAAGASFTNSAIVLARDLLKLGSALPGAGASGAGPRDRSRPRWWRRASAAT